jgi:hypothetical protein
MAPCFSIGERTLTKGVLYEHRLMPNVTPYKGNDQLPNSEVVTLRAGKGLSKLRNIRIDTESSLYELTPSPKQEIRMKRPIVIVFLVSCCFAASALAQQAPKEHSMTGCLQRAGDGNSYLVTDVDGSGPKTIGIVSSTANLAPHIGHKIEVTGTAVPAKDAEMDKSVPKAAHYMKLTGVKMISATCP